MAVGVSARESLKEMKRLKNEPFLLLVIIAIILFVGLFVVYPVVKVILFPDGATYMELFSRPRWFTAIKNSLFITLISTISCTAVAFLFAYVIARLDVPCKGSFRFITLLRGCDHPAFEGAVAGCGLARMSLSLTTPMWILPAREEGKFSFVWTSISFTC